MVDPIDLLLLEGASEHLIQRASGVEIVAEGLLDHDAGPPIRSTRFLCQGGFAEVIHYLREILGRSRKVEQPIPVQPEVLVQACEAFVQSDVAGVIVELGAVVEDISYEPDPSIPVCRKLFGKLLDSVT